MLRIEDLLIAGKRYYTAGGELPTIRETQSNLNRNGTGAVIQGARREGARARTQN